MIDVDEVVLDEAPTVVERDGSPRIADRLDTVLDTRRRSELRMIGDGRTVVVERGGVRARE